MTKTETKSFDLEVNVKSAVPIYEQIKNAVKLSLFSGRLKEGDQVVSIRELATRHNINPLTIMKAYNQLENEGFLFSRRGSGYFVPARDTDDRKEKKKIFKQEVADFLKRIGRLGFTAKDLLAEVKTYQKEASHD
jgi:GntR family transcriptional regulator